ncbi:hypothetical protein [Anatilimnocola floriformis]|uniref:hypothetical protein n=1 Tax=Anatilimnocola floriformis TaxID=2948575 RepID=UPI0020C2C010|nr:hypothetical protein [Anatilimnocola floriformis]
MDKETLLALCEPIKAVTIGSDTFHLRRIGQLAKIDLTDKYIRPFIEDKPERRKKLTLAERRSLSVDAKAKAHQEDRRNAEMQLDVLTLSLCDEAGEPHFSLAERDTVAAFPTAIYNGLVDVAFYHSFDNATVEADADAKKN